MVTVHGPVPKHTPFQPMNIQPEAGVATSPRAEGVTPAIELERLQLGIFHRLLLCMPGKALLNNR